MPLTRTKSIVSKLTGLGVSPTLAINQRCREMRQKGQKVYHLGIGQSPFPVPEFVVQALRDHAHEKDYLPVSGLPELREAVAEFHRRSDGIKAGPENVLIGPGSKELMHLLHFAFNGEIIVANPCWVSYVPQAILNSNKFHQIDTSSDTDWKITADILENTCVEIGHSKPKLLILNSPGNPDGGCYSSEELSEIATVARRHDLIVLSDEIYGLLHHEGEHVSMARFYPEGTIISSGLSKWCGAGGWRLGTFVFPKELDRLRVAVTAAGSETFSSVCAPIQYAAVEAYKGGDELENYILHSRRIVSALGNHCAEILRSAGIQVNPPKGGFYLFADLTPIKRKLIKKGITDSVGLCERLLNETRVAILPGAAFGRPKNELTVRLALVDFDGKAALKKSGEVELNKNLDKEFLIKNCQNVILAMKKIVSWVNT